MTFSWPVRWLFLAGLGVLHSVRLAAQAASADFGPPILRDWVQPDYPREAVGTKREGTVTVQFVVGKDGSVSREQVEKSTDEIFNAAALAAVRRWGFKPALEHGEPAACAMRVPVVFGLEQLRRKTPPLFPPMEVWPVALPETPAQPDRPIEPDYPAELEESRIPGAVYIEFTVDEEGRTSGLRVRQATNPAFVETSVRAIERAVFKPARQGPLAKRSVVHYPANFESLDARPSTILEANHLTLISEPAPVILPKVLMLISPVYPRDRLLAGEEGKAVAEFTVDAAGRPREISIVSAEHPDFGAALSAAIETWIFQPAQGETGPMTVRFRVTREFAATRSPAESRLAGLLQPGGGGVGGPAGLDRKLQPLWRGFPVYPQALRESRPAGEAQIEFIIDRSGRARLPKVLSASEEAFGWAAATAISQWVFERPTRGGEPVDITVQIPVGFEPPNE